MNWISMGRRERQHGGSGVKCMFPRSRVMAFLDGWNMEGIDPVQSDG